MLQQRIRFCQSGARRVAYAVSGRGPALVIDAGWLTHLEATWELAEYRAFIESLAQRLTVICFDKPGSGLSDRGGPLPTAEAQLRAAESVIAAAGVDRYAVLGLSQGGPNAVQLAIRNPGRVTHLVIYGSYAAGARLGTQQLRNAFVDLVRADWGIGSKTLADLFAAGATPDAVKWFARLQRRCATAEVAASMLEACFATDVSRLLPQVSVPALVVHRRDDGLIPYSCGTELAAAIPGAELLTLPGSTHIPYLGDHAALSAAIKDFVAGAEEDPVRLTAREQQVARLVSEGRSNAEIAIALGVTLRTAESHVEHIRGKLGAHSRAQIAAWAVSR